MFVFSSPGNTEIMNSTKSSWRNKGRYIYPVLQVYLTISLLPEAIKESKREIKRRVLMLNEPVSVIYGRKSFVL